MGSGVVVNVSRISGQGELGSAWKNAWMPGGAFISLTIVNAACESQSSIGVEMPVAVPLALYVGDRYVLVAGGKGSAHCWTLDDVACWMAVLVVCTASALTWK